MEFAELVRHHADRVVEKKSSIQNEEATKQSLILPFFETLGYNTKDTSEVSPEVNVGTGKSRGFIDYTIYISGKPVMIVEAKNVDTSINNKKLYRQLAEYFEKSSASIAVMTNGIDYAFYTDIDEQKKMDTKPFLSINFNQYIDVSNVLSHFKKGSFNLKLIKNFAKQTRTQNKEAIAIRAYIMQDIEAYVKSILQDKASDLKLVDEKRVFGITYKRFWLFVCSAGLDGKLKTINFFRSPLKQNVYGRPFVNSKNISSAISLCEFKDNIISAASDIDKYYADRVSPSNTDGDGVFRRV